MELIEHLGGVADRAAPASASQLVTLLRRELARGLEQLPGPRAGYDRPLVVPFLGAGRVLVTVVPVSARLRTDGLLVGSGPRGLLVVASALEALLLASDGLTPASGPGDLVARYAGWEAALVVAVPWPRAAPAAMGDAELAALAFDDLVGGVDRLRCRGAALPDDAGALVTAGGGGEDALAAPIGARHPLSQLEVLVRAGVEPAHAAAVALGAADAAASALLDAVLGPADAGHRPHDDPDPARRVARRILQMLMGKRKWSGGTGAGFHTEVTHLTRGFDARERELAAGVVEALLEAGLLVEKTSVGQRHVSLLSRRAADITALVDEGTVPSDLDLPG